MKNCIVLIVLIVLGLKANGQSDLFNKGLENIKSDKFEEALKQFNQVIDADPKNKDAFNQRGYVKNQLADFYGAIGDYNFAIDLDPSFAEAFNNRGEAKFNLGDDYLFCLMFKL